MRNFLIVLLLMVTSVFAGENAPDLDASRVAWSELDFKIHKLVINVSLGVSVNPKAVEQVKQHWITPSKGTAVAVSGSHVIELTDVVDVMGRRFDTTLWFDPTNAALIQRTVIETKKNTHQKTHRFTDSGYYMEWRIPKGKEEELAPKHWSELTKSYETYTPSYEEGSAVVGPSSVFWVLSASSLEKVGDTMELQIFAQSHVNILTFKVEGMEKISMDYIEVRNGTETKRSLKQALHISVKVRPLDPDGEVDFGHMGVAGDADYFIDPKTRIPVEMRGHMKMVGAVKTRLQRVILK